MRGFSSLLQAFRLTPVCVCRIGRYYVLVDVVMAIYSMARYDMCMIVGHGSHYKYGTTSEGFSMAMVVKKISWKYRGLGLKRWEIFSLFELYPLCGKGGY